jgi:hypothetical protein
MAENLTERQAKWFATIRDGLERETGKSMEAWVAIARTCPETKHRARLKWFKDTHGLLQNRASMVLAEAFESRMAWNEPEALIDAVWTDPAARAIFDAVRAAALALPDTIETARKGYTAWSRKVQFAAVKPLKGSQAMLGLAVAPDNDARLESAKGDGWSERLTARVRLKSPGDVPIFCEQMSTAWKSS